MQSLLFGLLDRWRSPPPKPAKVAWLSTVAYAHRGLHQPGVPENSLTAFRDAIDRGMGIECDVQRSSDGQAVVFHDFELDRLTSETGPVIQRSAEELTRIELSGSGDKIPTLKRMLDVSRLNPVHVVIAGVVLAICFVMFLLFVVRMVLK